MRFAVLAPALAMLTATVAHGQIRTTEETTTESQIAVDSASGTTLTRERVERVSRAEDITFHENMIYTDPFKFFGVFNIGYQRAIARNVSVGGVVQAPSQLTDRSGFGVIAEGRFYPGGNPFRSFHVGASLSYNHVVETFGSDAIDPGPERTINPVAFGVILGWHWYPWPDFGTEFALGADYVVNGVSHRDSEFSDYYLIPNINGLTPSFRFQISFAW